MEKRLNKRGISPIIATVLILVLTFVTISIVAVFVVPFVNDMLAGSQDCFDALGTVEFEETIYNCQAQDSSGNDRSGFSVRVGADSVVGLRIGLFSGGSSDIIDIFNDTDGSLLSPKIRILGENFGGNTLPVPQRGGVRTYVAGGAFNKIEVSPILNSGKICEVSDSINLGSCLDNTAISDLTEY